MRNRLVLLWTAILLLALCAGCAAASSSTLPPPAPRPPALTTTPPAPTAPASPTPSAAEVTVTGTADTSSGAPVAGVTVAFKLAADLGGSCETCGLYTAVTSAAGTYSVTLPTGLYEALCARTGATCKVMTNPPEATAQVTVDRNGSLDFLVAAAVASAPPSTQPTQTQAESGGNVVTGHMYYANGQPVANQDITFFDIDCTGCDYQPHVTTGADGSYSITLNDGVYQAQCDYLGGCGVQSNSTNSSGQGQTVNVPPGGTVNFVACRPNTGLPYPQCLQS